MSTIKTYVSEDSVEDFINAVPDESKKRDAATLLKLFTKITGEEAKLWSSGIIGFGKYHYKSEHSSQEGDWMLTGFSPRKQNLSLYLMHGFESNKDFLKGLGKHKIGMGCLYINKLADVDLATLEKLIKKTYDDMKKQTS